MSIIRDTKTGREGAWQRAMARYHRCGEIVERVDKGQLIPASERFYAGEENAPKVAMVSVDGVRIADASKEEVKRAYDIAQDKFDRAVSLSFDSYCHLIQTPAPDVEGLREKLSIMFKEESMAGEREVTRILNSLAADIDALFPPPDNGSTIAA